MNDERTENERQALSGKQTFFKIHDFEMSKDMMAEAVGTKGPSSMSIMDRHGQWRKSLPLKDGDEITEPVHDGEKCFVLNVYIRFEESG
jgi:hypothetical protein